MLLNGYDIKNGRHFNYLDDVIEWFDQLNDEFVIDITETMFHDNLNDLLKLIIYPVSMGYTSPQDEANMRYLEANYPKFVSRSWGAEVYCELNCTDVVVGDFLTMLNDIRVLEDSAVIDDETYMRVEREFQVEEFAGALNLETVDNYDDESAGEILDQYLESTDDYILGMMDGTAWYISRNDWDAFMEWARENTAIEFKEGN